MDPLNQLGTVAPLNRSLIGQAARENKQAIEGTGTLLSGFYKFFVKAVKTRDSVEIFSEYS